MKCENKKESTSKMDHIENLLSFIHAKLDREIKDREQSDTWWQRDIERLGNMQATLTDLSEDLLARIQTLEEKIKKLEARK